MTNWRTILGWQVGPDWPQIGDKVRVIADGDLLASLYDLPNELSGKVGIVTRIYSQDRNAMTPEEEAETIAVKFPGVLYKRHGLCYFPTEYWKEALEVVR